MRSMKSNDSLVGGQEFPETQPHILGKLLGAVVCEFEIASLGAIPFSMPSVSACRATRRSAVLRLIPLSLSHDRHCPPRPGRDNKDFISCKRSARMARIWRSSMAVVLRSALSRRCAPIQRVLICRVSWRFNCASSGWVGSGWTSVSGSAITTSWIASSNVVHFSVHLTLRLGAGIRVIGNCSYYMRQVVHIRSHSS